MSFFASFRQSPRFRFFSVLAVFSLLLSVITLAQINLTHRLLTAYTLNTDAKLTRGKPTLLMLEQADDFEKAFTPDATETSSKKKSNVPNFTKETAIGIVLPSTNKPPKLAVSRVFVQDSTLTIRYIRMTDTTLTKNPLPTAVHPTLLFTIPKQTVLKTRLIENGKVVHIVKKQDE
ncbi:hypothetical protein IC229_15420 [Spirosoma sp. BT702]|uniref:Uncharacterized protein n=1 Tax=Spirosoma profusum TaxID=2771354 RepID=A0A926XWU0_9BACT|nr:hypothetical protein [Spirosoma profusum]MBD2702039.1 hypothetical protein [Spirosoma profusum]